MQFGPRLIILRILRHQMYQLQGSSYSYPLRMSKEKIFHRNASKDVFKKQLQKSYNTQAVPQFDNTAMFPKPPSSKHDSNNDKAVSSNCTFGNKIITQINTSSNTSSQPMTHPLQPVESGSDLYNIEELKTIFSEVFISLQRRRINFL